MAVTQYIGARYVPLFANPLIWDSTKEYEPLTIVLYEGNSYTSRQAVPVGISITNETFWAQTGNYNAQVEQYRTEVRTFDSRITANSDAIADFNEELGSFEEETRSAIAAEASARQAADEQLSSTIESEIAAEASARQSAIAAEASARQAADTNLANDLANEVSARQAADTAILNRFPVSGSDIANQSITRSKLASDVLTLHASAQNDWPKAYINANTGDDSTAVINDSGKPFKTMQAALDEMSILGNNYDFIFQTAGNFTFTQRFFVGGVVHFRAPSDVTGTINMTCNGSTGAVYFYDTHVNFMGTDSCRINFNMAGRLIEEEGSVFWTNHTDFTCTYMQLVQGSAWLNDVTLNGYIAGWFCNLRLRDLTIHNTSNAPALRVSTGVVRFEVGGITIKRNANAPEQAAIYIESTHASLTANMLGDSNIGYLRYFDARGSVVNCSDDYLASMNSYGASENCQFISLSLRVRTASIYPAAS